MLSIGELAHRAGVSVRMLRHYDALGLVTPERIDPTTGYRWYTAAQIGRVNTLIAFKELGFTLDQCRDLLDDQVSFEELHGMLRLRRAELKQRLESDRRRLAGVERRLRSIEDGMTMTNSTLRFESLPALRLAQVSGVANDASEISAVVEALSRTLASCLSAAGVALGGRVCTYHGRPDGSRIDVTVGVPLAPGADPVEGLEPAELPFEERAVTVTQHRTADASVDPWLTVDVALAERGLEPYGLYRAIQLGDAADGQFAVELQCPVRESGGRDC